MSLTTSPPPSPPTAQLPLSTTNASAWGSTTICQKLLCVCYYYSRCIGMVAFGIRRCKVNNSKIRKNIQESINIERSNELLDQPTCTPNVQQNQTTDFVLQAYVLKSMIWFHIVIHIVICIIMTYASLNYWQYDNFIFSILLYSQVISISLCPTVTVIVELWHRRRIIGTINFLFRLMKAIEEFHSSYEIFQWSHVAFVAVKVVTFVYEIIGAILNSFVSETWYEITIEILQNFLLMGIWLNLHVATLLYICVEAMYGSLNHYMKHIFILRLQVIQSFGPVTPSTHVKQLTADLVKFICLFKKVHFVGLKLHYLWQLPLVLTLVVAYLGAISIIYFVIWQYVEVDAIQMRYIPYLLKLVFDIMLLSLAAHRAIKSSQVIRCMGLENVVLVENEEWHRQMEQFLYHINLYDFKLNCLGLVDITNAITLTFISGVLTSISVFVPFIIKGYRIQKFLEKQN